MATTSFWEHPIDRLEKALSIRKQIAALQNKLGSLFSGDDAPAATPRARKGGRRRMSPAARARIAAAQRERWAKQKGATIATLDGSVTASSVSPRKRGKRTMSPEARERIAAAQRARWARRKGTSGASTGAVQKSPAKRRGGRRKISPEARAKMAEAARKRWARVKKAA
jgi:hypothetical protein